MDWREEFRRKARGDPRSESQALPQVAPQASPLRRDAVSNLDKQVPKLFSEALREQRKRNGLKVEFPGLGEQLDDII